MRALLSRGLPAAVIIGGAAWGGFFAYGRWARPHISPMAVASAVRRTSSLPAHSGAPGTADGEQPTTAAAVRSTIPDTLPDIPFVTRDGVTRRLAHWQGHPLLVNFWAPWCEPCRQEIPLLERLSRQHSTRGLQVIGIAVDSRAAVLDYARRAGIQYPLLIGQRAGLAAVRDLGMEAVLPFSVFADARGRIVTLKIGRLRSGEAELILGRVDALDRGRIDLATARREIADGMSRLAVARAQRKPVAPL
jgi:thiol-disulfide isomerase/thioredoxin